LLCRQNVSHACEPHKRDRARPLSTRYTNQRLQIPRPLLLRPETSQEQACDAISAWRPTLTSAESPSERARQRRCCRPGAFAPQGPEGCPRRPASISGGDAEQNRDSAQPIDGRHDRKIEDREVLNCSNRKQNLDSQGVVVGDRVERLSMRAWEREGSCTGQHAPMEALTLGPDCSDRQHVSHAREPHKRDRARPLSTWYTNQRLQNTTAAAPAPRDQPRASSRRHFSLEADADVGRESIRTRAAAPLLPPWSVRPTGP